MTPLAFSLDLALSNAIVHVSNWTEPFPSSTTTNATNATHPPTPIQTPLALSKDRMPWEAALVGSVLGFLILIMVVGNILVILAILLERDLQRPQYYLILSLGVADLMVGILVSPLATVYEIHRGWRLGVQLCDFWISMDVFSCTSSILHLVAIALDRYWSITNILYTQKRTPKRIFVMLAIVWATSLIISVAPILGWKDEQFQNRVLEEKDCLISQDLGYQVFSTTAAFYGPLVLIIVVYWKIFKAAKSRIRRSQARNAPPKKDCPVSSTMRLVTAPLNKCEDEDEDPESGNSPSRNGEAAEGGPDRETSMTLPPAPSPKTPKRTARETAEARRERKAWRTLAIITGTFVGCWLPFFILAIARPICAKSWESSESQHSCEINPVLESMFLWLGYLNSAINPIIYTIFSPDFRKAFQKILKRLCFMS